MKSLLMITISFLLFTAGTLFSQDGEFYNLYLDGNGYLVMQDYAKAVDKYNKALTRFQIDYVYLNRGNAKMGLKDLPGAMQDFNKAIAMNVDCATAYFQRGLIKIQQGDLAGGCEDLKAARKYDTPGASDAVRKNCK